MTIESKSVVGVLALQGDFQAHGRVLERLGATVREVRVSRDLAGLDGLVIPGGESTTMTLGVAREGLAEPLRELAARGTPVLGSCAGLIMLDREHLGILDMLAERNAFGRQLRSFEADVLVKGLDRGAFAWRVHPCALDRPTRPGRRDLGRGRRACRGRAPGPCHGGRVPHRARARRSPSPAALGRCRGEQGLRLSLGLGLR